METRKQVYSRDEVDNHDNEPMDTSSSANYDSLRAENMPELLALIEDQEVLDHLKNPKTTEYLRTISIDPSKIPTVTNTPEMKFLKLKILQELKKTHPEIDVDTLMTQL
jgi:hypothetical protein